MIFIQQSGQLIRGLHPPDVSPAVGSTMILALSHDSPRPCYSPRVSGRWSLNLAIITHSIPPRMISLSAYVLIHGGTAVASNFCHPLFPASLLQ